MSGFSGDRNGSSNPFQRAISWLSLIMAFAITFIFTPRIHSASVDWALLQMDGYGWFMVWMGSVFWFILVALLTFVISNLALMVAITLGQFLFLMFAAKIAR